MSVNIDFTTVNKGSMEFAFLADGRNECLEGLKISEADYAENQMYTHKLVAIDSIAPNLEASYELLGINEHPLFSREDWEKGYNDLYYWEWVGQQVRRLKASYEKPAIPRPTN